MWFGGQNDCIFTAQKPAPPKKALKKVLKKKTNRHFRSVSALRERKLR
jgi:hypothetical protein